MHDAETPCKSAPYRCFSLFVWQLLGSSMDVECILLIAGEDHDPEEENELLQSRERTLPLRPAACTRSPRPPATSNASAFAAHGFVDLPDLTAGFDDDMVGWYQQLGDEALEWDDESDAHSPMINADEAALQWSSGDILQLGPGNLWSTPQPLI